MRAIADFEPIRTLWLCWPHNPADWPGKIEAARWAFIEFLRAALGDASIEVVVIVPQNEDCNARIRSKILKGVGSEALQRVTFHPLLTNRGWMRDISPTWVHSGWTLSAVCWGFTGWAKYPDHHLDASIAPLIAASAAQTTRLVSHSRRPIVLEGGAFDVNGQGALLATRECLLDPEVQVRNPGFTQADYERIFRTYLGVEDVIWLDRGLVGDDTHGHIDDVARFAAPTTILTTVADQGDPNEEALSANLQGLRSLWPRYSVVEVPLPTVMFDGERLPASYMNFLILNDRVLVPTFNHAYDAEALRAIGQAVGRPAIGVSAVDLVWGYGTLHCLSHTVPKV